MKRILCTSIVLIMLLTACSAPAQQPPSTELNGGVTYGVYELDFSVERLSGWPFEGWDFVYTYNGEKIQNGHSMARLRIYQMILQYIPSPGCLCSWGFLQTLTAGCFYAIIWTEFNPSWWSEIYHRFTNLPRFYQFCPPRYGLQRPAVRTYETPRFWAVLVTFSGL